MKGVISFGGWVKRRRKELDLTQQDLARFVGCSTSAIIKIEAGVRRPSRQIAERLLQYLEIPSEEQQTFISMARTVPVPPGPLAPVSTRPNNLPARLTSLVGRRQEIVTVRNLLFDSSRLVTLVGPGGIGKTRLGLEVAADLLESQKDGAFFVSLSPITEPGLVPSAIAQTLGVKEAAGRTMLESLKNYLRDRQLLLVLDNFEQVAEAAPMMSELLVAAPQLKMLVTSRAVLHLYGEQQFIVPPLGLPDTGHLPAPGDLARYEAVRLFVERARLVKPDFDIAGDDAQARAVVEICHRLDGLPLAIELAAARINILAPVAMLPRLGSRLKLLVAGAQDLPPRQQTLRNAIGWSYDLLDKNEKTLFRRLSIFVGGHTLDAVEAVCSLEDDPSAGSGQALQANILECIESLVDKSLVLQYDGPDGEPWLSMLETIHEFARELLEESGEYEQLRERHAAYYVELAEEAEPQLAGVRQAQWLERLEDEHDNLRAALRWARGEAGGSAAGSESGDAETALRLAGALWRFWLVRGHYSEGREQLMAALAMDDGRQVRSSVVRRPSSKRAKSLIGAGILAWRQNDYEAARSLSEESLTIYRDLGDKRGIAQSLNNMGNVAHSRGDYPSALAYFRESLAARRELGDKRGIADSLNNLALVVDEQGEYESALSLYEESLSIYRELGDKRGTANSLNNLALVAWERGDHGRARSLLEESVSMYKELGDRRGIANALNNLGLVAWEQGDYPGARTLYEEGLARYRDLEDRQGIADCLEGLARVAGSQSTPARAAQLWGAAEALRETIGIGIPPGDVAEYERNVSAARAMLDEAGWEAAWAAGRDMPPEQAIAYALSDS
jgi:predicted ATPase/transcriptional regulator with XRE-family HTH domain